MVFILQYFILVNIYLIMSVRSIRKNILRSRLFEGRLQGNKRGFAFFRREEGDFFIPHENLHGAQHGDTVVVRPTKGDQAEVVKIIKRGVKRLSGTVDKVGRTFYLIPDNGCYFSDVKIVGESKIKVGEKVIVDILDYEDNHYPLGEVVKVLGFEGDETTEMLSTLYGYGFADTFPEEVIKRTEWLYPLEIGDRLDLRELLTVTIDGEDARDFDDAISVAKTDEGFTLWVHIADVSSYVIKGDPIDAEAYKRGTSVYFPKCAYPMLPERLCNELCSLREGEDKATVSVCMEYDFEGSLLSAKPYNTYINSNHRLTYTLVEEMFEGIEHSEYDDVKQMLFDGLELSKLLSKAREERGSIDFSGADSKIIFKDGKLADVECLEQRASELLIENFMISANECVASMLERANYPCVYRIHEEPDPMSLKQFTLFASCFMPVPKDRYFKPQDIAGLMRECKGTPEGVIVSKVGIKSMQKAEYSPYNIGHYGLASQCYCHFTSPIRRYPDLIVHRMLKRYMTGKLYADLEGKQKEMEEYCAQCSERERSAERAERDALDYYKTLYMSEHIGEEFDGIVSGVIQNSIFVALDNGIEGRISLESIGEKFYFDEMRYTLVGERLSIRIGDPARIQVLKADVLTRKIEFLLIF